jgi:hypothetical protein
VQEQAPLGDLPGAYFIHVRQLHQQRSVILRVGSSAI